jgi:arginine/ornithine N-succinyltransferase beta subunit
MPLFRIDARAIFVWISCFKFLASAIEQYFSGRREPPAIKKFPEQTSVTQTFFIGCVQKTTRGYKGAAAIAVSAGIRRPSPVFRNVKTVRVGTIHRRGGQRQHVADQGLFVAKKFVDIFEGIPIILVIEF